MVHGVVLAVNGDVVGCGFYSRPVGARWRLRGHRHQRSKTAPHQSNPSNSFRRDVAGADIAADIVKCKLELLRKRDHPVLFNADE